ncbi:selenocysteine-specific translation elongation factor [Vulgatibacter sp.]|uniref:selenocysteine-specific translation elongation factor n=1 Tax=Vulgatibacter sp. TaxID=1971226 RepID=UPI003562B3C6
MRRVVIGTAGHIDHGKTALVRALTGIDTDRLKEEKQRGITIELGFAHLDLGDGTVAGLVDVPGHERFVRAMAAGAGGMDLAVLVVAADEGVMPQTREHVDILRLLGVRTGVVALTKADLLPGLGAEWLDLLHADLADVCAGTILDGAQRVLCSARTGAGLDDLVAALRRAAAGAEERPTDGPLYLPVDRAFTIRGFGTVATGTLLSGSVAAEEAIDLVPAGSTGLRVRGVQVHGAPVERAFAGQRVAVNLSGVEAQQIERGMVLGAHGQLPPTPMLDVELSLLESAPRALAHRSKWLLHVGTAQVPATVSLLDREAIGAGETALAQLRLAAPVAALPGQHFILRGFAPIPGRGHTVAGGRILAILPRKHRRGRPEIAAGLAVLREGDAAARIERILVEAGAAGLDAGALAVRTALPAKALARSLEQLGSRGAALCYDRERRAWVATSILDRLARKSILAVQRHHEEQPLAPGLPREELRARLGLADPKLFARLVGLLGERGIEAVGEHLSQRGRKAGSGATDQALRERVLGLVRAGGLTPPAVAELAAAAGEEKERLLAMLKLLEGEGLVVRVSQEFFFEATAVGTLRERLVDFLLANEAISTQEFKELVGATRKWVMPLGEFFDREKVTLRVADTRRVLRGDRDTWRERREAGAR